MLQAATGRGGADLDEGVDLGGAATFVFDGWGIGALPAAV